MSAWIPKQQMYQKHGETVSQRDAQRDRDQRSALPGNGLVSLWSPSQTFLSAHRLMMEKKLLEMFMPVRLIVLALLLGAAFAAFAQTTPTAAPPNPCLAPEQKELDVWVGDWDLTWPGAKQGDLDHGTNTIRRVLDGCVIEENFSAEGSGHLRGRSVSLFEPQSGEWKQTWVDNEGGYLDFTGKFANGQMTLARRATRNGKPILQRMVFKNITPNEFDWSWESSTDGGKTWQVNWPIHYKRKTT